MTRWAAAQRERAVDVGLRSGRPAPLCSSFPLLTRNVRHPSQPPRIAPASWSSGLGAPFLSRRARPASSSTLLACHVWRSRCRRGRASSGGRHSCGPRERRRRRRRCSGRGRPERGGVSVRHLHGPAAGARLRACRGAGCETAQKPRACSAGRRRLEQCNARTPAAHSISPPPAANQPAGPDSLCVRPRLLQGALPGGPACAAAPSARPAGRRAPPSIPRHSPPPSLFCTAS